MAQNDTHIDLYTAQTPNGIKISITLEELNLKYNVHAVKIAENEQKTPEFLAINPNGRIPAVTDTKFKGSETIHLFESGSIQQYLVDEYDHDHKISYPKGSREYYETNNWLFFLNAGVGPMQGQANHFTRYAPEKIPYGVNRYQNETRRLYGVLNEHLKKKNGGYLVGDKCTIADIAHYGWVSAAHWAGVEIEGKENFPYLDQWQKMMSERPAVKKGKDVPEPSRHSKEDLKKNPELAKKIEEESRKWVQQGMQEDAAKHGKKL